MAKLLPSPRPWPSLQGRFRPRRGTNVRLRVGWDPKKLDVGEGGGLPYEYDENELQELADLMPPPLEARPLPSSKVEMKRLLEKHGVRCDATFGFDSDVLEPEQETKQQAALSRWGQTRPDFDELWTDETPEDAATAERELTPEEERFLRMVDFGYEAMLEQEETEIFEKAMELHHSQRERSRNIYATCMWYAKKLEAAELQSNYETADPNPVPTYLQAMYTLEEEFEELNKKQYDVELKIQEQALAIEDAEFREFLRGTVINMPTRPGDPYHDLLSPAEEAVQEEDEEEPDLDIDVYLHGILPNAEADKGLPVKKKDRPDAYLNELLFKEDEMD